MVIDFHTHVFPDKIAAKTVDFLKGVAHIQSYTDGTVKGLLASMEAGNIDCSVILPVVTSVKQFDTITRFADSINQEYGYSMQEGPPRLLSFGGIHPDSPDYKEQLHTLASLGFKGIKLHPDYQLVNFNDIRCKRIISEASALGLMIVVHAGIDVGYPSPVHCTPQMALEVIQETKPEKLVLAHYGGWKLWEEVEQLLVGQPVYFDTSYTMDAIGKEQFLRILNHHGSDKILFATDSPWSGQKESHEWICRMGIPQEQLEQILHGNAEKLLGF